MAERPLSMNWNLMKDYLTKEVEYKDESRRLISEALGFEPDLKISIVPEIQLRSSVREYKNGEITRETLNKHIATMKRYIFSFILKRLPDQAHLLDKDEVENFSL